MDPVALVAQLVQERLAPVFGFASGSDVSALAERALAVGASDVLERSSLRASTPDHPARQALGQRIASHTSASRSGTPVRRSSLRASSALPSRSSISAGLGRGRLVAIGASTGGTLALAEVLRELPADAAPVLVVQHMLPEFTRDFAERLNAACAVEVSEATHGDRVQRGRVLIAPGGMHMRLGRDLDAGLCVFLSHDAPVGKHRPSVDVLFQSCAEVVRAAAVGVLLTGMGDDGARGLLAMRSAGARTIVQDQASSVCVGMPSAAIHCGAAQEVLSLHQIARALVEIQGGAGVPSLPFRG